MSEEEANTTALKRAACVSFWRCLNTKTCMRLMDEARSKWQDPVEGRYYRDERRLVAEHLEPLKHGVFIGVFIFLAFRVSGSQWFTRIRNKHGYTMSVLPQTEESLSKSKRARPEFKSYSEQQEEKMRVVWTDASNVTSDLIVSVLCGTSATFLLSDQQKLMRDFARIPLLPGKSVISTHTCNDMVAAYDKLDTSFQFNADDSNRTLATFHSFVKNCRLRTEFLSSRELQGLKKQADIVPQPGLDDADHNYTFKE